MAWVMLMVGVHRLAQAAGRYLLLHGTETAAAAQLN
jgi:hypothetical protein